MNPTTPLSKATTRPTTTTNTPSIGGATRPVEKKDLHCDHCGKPANSIDFVPYVIDCKKVLFACPDHEPTRGLLGRLKPISKTNTTGTHTSATRPARRLDTQRGTRLHYLAERFFTFNAD